MRLALTIAALAGLAACGGQPEPGGPERRSAAGEVLGGEVTDDMLPLDTARSTSPPDAGAGAGEAKDGNTPAQRDRADPVLPRPTLSAAPAPDMTMPADPEPLRTPE